MFIRCPDLEKCALWETSICDEMRRKVNRRKRMVTFDRGKYSRGANSYLDSAPFVSTATVRDKGDGVVGQFPISITGEFNPLDVRFRVYREWAIEFVVGGAMLPRRDDHDNGRQREVNRQQQRRLAHVVYYAANGRAG
jgi:hypothetical protein